MNHSQKLFEKAQKLIRWSQFCRAFRSVGEPFLPSRQRAHLTTADDQELIDYVCTWGPAIHGHDHPKFVKQ